MKVGATYLLRVHDTAWGLSIGSHSNDAKTLAAELVAITKHSRYDKGLWLFAHNEKGTNWWLMEIEGGNKTAYGATIKSAGFDTHRYGWWLTYNELPKMIIKRVKS